MMKVAPYPAVVLVLEKYHFETNYRMDAFQLLVGSYIFLSALCDDVATFGGDAADEYIRSVQMEVNRIGK